MPPTCTSCRSFVRRRREHFRSHVRATAVRCRQGDGARDPARRSHRHGELDSDDPTLVAQILKISSAYSPPPPEGFVSPMTWGIESNVIERFAAAGIPEEKISFVRDTYTFTSRLPIWSRNSESSTDQR